MASASSSGRPTTAKPTVFARCALAAAAMALPAVCHTLGPQSATGDAFAEAPRPTSPKYRAFPPKRRKEDEPFAALKSSSSKISETIPPRSASSFCSVPSLRAPVSSFSRFSSNTPSARRSPSHKAGDTSSIKDIDTGTSGFIGMLSVTEVAWTGAMPLVLTLDATLRDPPWIRLGKKLACRKACLAFLTGAEGTTPGLMLNARNKEQDAMKRVQEFFRQGREAQSSSKLPHSQA
mmetsp:Transcript_26260/g.62444  ORF Transcript_26260/g.62444 Transcript_26260/m.62444 type:complete len:235 (-) Transcript_26260:53-757(-)